MTPEIFHKVKAYISNFNLALPTVLEVGSQDVNGSVRELFTSGAKTSSYLGIDMQEGRGVDLVTTPIELLNTAKAYDAIVCLEVLEHDSRFWETIKAITSLLKPGGYFFVSVPTYGFPYHGYPKDYYRFSLDSFSEVILGGYTVLDISQVKDTVGNPGLIALARKPFEP